MGEFVGKRVVPDHVGVWNQKKTYEPLMIVLDGETGDSYISRKAVPVGISLSDESYWSLCAHYSAQMRKLEQDVDEDVQQMHSDVTAVKNAMSQEFQETHTAISKELDDTHKTISQELSETEQRVNENLEQTSSELTGKVEQAQTDLNTGRKELNDAKTTLNKRMDSIAGGMTTDSEILDARVDNQGTTHASLKRIEAVPGFSGCADAVWGIRFNSDRLGQPVIRVTSRLFHYGTCCRIQEHSVVFGNFDSFSNSIFVVLVHDLARQMVFQAGDSAIAFCRLFCCCADQLCRRIADSCNLFDYPREMVVLHPCDAYRCSSCRNRRNTVVVGSNHIGLLLEPAYHLIILIIEGIQVLTPAAGHRKRIQFTRRNWDKALKEICDLQDHVLGVNRARHFKKLGLELLALELRKVSEKS